MIPHEQKEKAQHAEQETPMAAKQVRPSQKHSSLVGFAALAGLMIVALLCGGIVLFFQSIIHDSEVPPELHITEYPLPTTESYPEGIAAGPDGNLWFTERDGNKIGRISPSGAITEYPLPTTRSGPAWITAGPDGNLWFTEFDNNKIGRISPAGGSDEFGVYQENSGPQGITRGPDGNLWFTDVTGNKIGRFSPGEMIVPYD
jgi:streptogramin lyase